MIADTSNAHLNNRVGNVSRTLVPIQIWLILFSAGISVLALRSVVYNLIFNHLMFFQWGHLGLVLATAGMIGLTAHLPDQLNLWQKIKGWANQHKITTSLLLLGTVMLNPTFTCLMALTGYLLEKHAARYLNFLSHTTQAIFNYTVEFFEFMGGIRNPSDFIKGVWLNLGKISAVVLGIGSAAASYMSVRWAIDPLLYSGLHASVHGMSLLGSALNYTFSGGFIPMFILKTMASILTYTMTVMVPFSIAMVSGMAAAWAWDNRFKFANAVDNKFNEFTNTYCDPVFKKLADKSRPFRAKYMGLNVLPEPVEGFGRGNMSYEQAVKIIDMRKKQSASKNAVRGDAPAARTYIVSRPTAVTAEVEQDAQAAPQVERRYPVRHRKQTSRFESN